MIKDDKPDFEVNLPTRIINLTRPEIGRIGKVIHYRVNQLIKKRLEFLQGISTPDVINWFNGISDKRNCLFIQFDIVDFTHMFPGIFLLWFLEFAGEYSDISNKKLDIIMNCRRSVFIHNKGQQIKNNSVNQFDISMGLLDSAESSNLVGLFIFYNLTTYDDININSIVLYRGDDLMLVKNSTKVKADKIRKLIHREFKF